MRLILARDGDICLATKFTALRHLEMEFNLFILTQNSKMVEDPYFAVSSDGTRLLRISDDLIHFDSLMDENDIYALVDHYTLTSRTISYDLQRFDQLVKMYTGYNRYSCAAHFKTDGNFVMLTYAKPPRWKNFTELIDPNHDDPHALQILDEINFGLFAILPRVFGNL